MKKVLHRMGTPLKISVMALGLGIAFFACNKKNSSNGKANPQTRIKISKLNRTVDKYPNVLTVDEANKLILAYTNDSSKNATTSFLYNAAELSSFINSAGNLKNMHFLLGESNTSGNQKTLTLIITGIDSNGYHVYLQDDSSINYVLEPSAPCPTCSGIANGGANLEAPGSSTNYVTASYTQNTLLDSAQKMIDAYAKRTTKNTTATAFLYSQPVLKDYLAKASGAAQFQFFMAEESNGQLTLVMLGVDANGNHIYITNSSNHYYALENCDPCPTCNAANGGSYLE